MEVEDQEQEEGEVEDDDDDPTIVDQEGSCFNSEKFILKKLSIKQC